MGTLRMLPPSIAALWMLCACAISATNPATLGPAGPATTLHVDNGHWEDVSVYLVRSGVRIRLGVVEGLGRRTFGLSGAQLGTGRGLALHSELRVSRAEFTSAVFDAQPGQRVEYTIAMHPRLSSVLVR